MTAERKPRNILLVTEKDLEAITHWPLELRALYDPQVLKALHQREQQAREEARRRWAELPDEIPF